MSILIKGVDMPTRCGLCPAYHHAADVCQATYKEMADHEYGERPSDCPLVEVPTSHGRLIDADKLLWEEGQMSVIQDASYGRGREGMKNAIRNAPTVIEAEEYKNE